MCIVNTRASFNGKEIYDNSSNIQKGTLFKNSKLHRNEEKEAKFGTDAADNGAKYSDIVGVVDTKGCKLWINTVKVRSNLSFQKLPLKLF